MANKSKNYKENYGGVRKNAGRKKLTDKKKQVCMYLKESKIESIGGKKKTREIAEEYVNSYEPEKQ
jgi:hypothetical protein